MARQQKEAKEWLRQFNKETETEITVDREQVELIGEIEFEDFKLLTKISLEYEQDEPGGITKVTFKNCPNLVEVDFDFNQVKEVLIESNMNNLKWFDFVGNNLTKVDLTKIPNVENVNLGKNPNFSGQIEGLEYLTKLVSLSVGGRGLNNKELKNKIDQSKTFSNDKASLQSEIDRLRGEIREIASALSLPETATKEEVLGEIKKLLSNKNNGNHSDYETIKAENDKLKAENALLIKGDEKYQKYLKLLAKIEDLEKVGVKFSQDEKEVLNRAESIEKLEEAKVGMFKDKFGKLISKNGDYFKISVLLAISTVCSVMFAGYSLFKKSNSAVQAKRKK